MPDAVALNDDLKDQLKELEDQGPFIVVRGGKVVVRGHSERLTDSQSTWIQQNEKELVRLLSGPGAGLGESADSKLDVPQPALNGQEMLWTHAHRNPANYRFVSNFNLKAPVVVAGPLDLARLQAAFDAVLAAHPAFRTRFFEDGGKLFRRFSTEPINITALTIDDEPDWPSKFVGELRALGDRPHDLNGGVLTRCTLLRLPDGNHVVQLEVHHAIFDHLSTMAAVADLLRYYISGPPSDEEIVERQRRYRGFLEWERSDALRDRRRIALDRWRRLLAPVREEGSSFRLDGERTPDKTQTNTVSFCAIEGGVLSAIERLARSLGVTLPSVFFAAMFALIHEECDQEAVVIAMPEDGRRRNEFAGLCDYFAVSIPILAQVRGDDTPASLIKAVHGRLPELREEPTTLGMLDEAFKNKPKTQPYRLAHILCNVLRESAQPRLRVGDLEFGSVAEYYPGREVSIYPEVSFDAMIQIQWGADGGLMQWAFNSGLLYPSSIARLQKRYIDILSGFSKNPNGPMRSL